MDARRQAEHQDIVTPTEEPASSRIPRHVRPRRNRRADWVRRLVRENTLTPADLIWPFFVTEGSGVKEPVPSMPSVCRHSIDEAVAAVKDAYGLGVPAVAIFPHTNAALRDERGTEALNPDNLVCRTVRAIKDAVPEIGIITDVALDPYTSHGHDGLIDENGRILNDESVEVLVEQARVQAEAGADVIAPSDMMDGRVAAIRVALEQCGLQDTQIMSYTAKYASGYYGPFRDAIGSSGMLKGDKRTYQMDPGNSEEAIREAALDIEEGADMLMVKPGMPYLDVLRRLKDTFGMPTFAYQVSGEYAMLAAAFERGWLDRDRIVLETLTCFKRAGADGVLTYFALDAARLINDGA